jgi:hypothetical protein
MNQYAIAIKSGNYKTDTPRLNYVNNQTIFHNYALLYVKIDNYDRFLTVEYNSTLNTLIDKIQIIINKEIDKLIMKELLLGEEVWINDSTNSTLYDQGTGYIFQLFHIQEPETESIKRMLFRIIDTIPGVFEGSDIDEYQAYNLEEFDTLLPEFFLIYPCEN